MDDSASMKVIQEIAEREGVERFELSALYNAIDPDALDRLFRGATGKVIIEFLGYRVIVESEGEVRIQDVDSTEMEIT